MCKTDNAIQRIQNYVESYCSVLNVPCGTDLFKKRSYRRWAAYEICDLIASHPFDDVDAIIEDFMLDIMYEIPKDDNIGMVTITKEYVEKKGGPLIMMRGCAQIAAVQTQA